MFSLSPLQQVMQLIPWGAFDASVKRHQTDKHNKGFTSRRHLIAMVHVQLSGATSLRVLESSFNPHKRHHYHLGMKLIHRSTLSDANGKRDPIVFAETAAALMQLAGRQLRDDREQMLYLLDSTSVHLDGPGFGWAREHATRHQGLKMHVVYSAATQHLVWQSITPANVNDISEGRKLLPPQGATLVYDRGYCDYNWWHRLNAQGVRFVTRPKSNAAFVLVRQRRIPARDAAVILADRIETFKHSSNRGRHRNPYKAQVRRIQVAREGKLPMWLVTNDLRSSAVQIAELYKKRWGIESLFKWIKQHLKIKHFHGESENAVRIQLLTALIAYLLVLIYKARYQLTASPWQVLAELRHGLFVRKEPPTSDKRRRPYREPFIAPGQYQLL